MRDFWIQVAAGLTVAAILAAGAYAWQERKRRGTKTCGGCAGA